MNGPEVGVPASFKERAGFQTALGSLCSSRELVSAPPHQHTPRTYPGTPCMPAHTDTPRTPTLAHPAHRRTPPTTTASLGETLLPYESFRISSPASPAASTLRNAPRHSGEPSHRHRSKAVPGLRTSVPARHLAAPLYQDTASVGSGLRNGFKRSAGDFQICQILVVIFMFSFSKTSKKYLCKNETPGFHLYLHGNVSWDR